MGENYNTGIYTIRVGRDYVCLNFGSNLAASASVLDRGTSDCVSGGRACCDMRWSTSRVLSLLPRSFSAKAGIDKAEADASAKKIDSSVLLNSRLYPDMFALTRQVQIASDQAKNGSARLAGVEAPRYEDNETTIDQLKARIAKTVAYLKTLDPKQIDASADREITFPLGPTNKGRMKGDDYLNHFVLPNFYFHLTTAYAILRHCGVDIGKRDFLGAIPIEIT
jgi:uncharacterized protein